MTIASKTINFAAAIVVGIATLGAASSAQAGGFGFGFNNHGGGYFNVYQNRGHNHYSHGHNHGYSKKRCWYKKRKVWSDYHNHYHWKKVKVCRKAYY